MNTNSNDKLPPVGALDALTLFEPDFSITRDQPAEAETRAAIEAGTNAENVPSEGEDHQA
jgi:hypothetical protein